MSGIMYLQMRNGLTNSFPNLLSDRPTAGARFKFQGPEAEKADPDAIASPDGSLRIEKTRLFRGDRPGGLGPGGASAL